MYSVTKN